MDHSDLPKPLILIADDDRSLRKLLNLALVQVGYQVVQVGSGEQAIQDFQRLQPDLVLLDAMMPDRDGFECCQHLRQVFTTDVPILMVTVLDDQSSIDRAFEVGATDYITKPIHWAVLRQRVKRLLGSSLALKNAQQTALEWAKAQAWETLQRRFLNHLSQRTPFPQFLDQTIEPLRQIVGAEQIWVQDAKNQKLLSVETLQHHPETERILEDLKQLTPIANQIVYYSADMSTDDDDDTDNRNISKTIAEKLSAPTLMMAPIFKKQKVWGWLLISGPTEQNHDNMSAQRSLDIAQWIAIALP
ncbi:MAG: response regulator [Cyanobacteria bacterium P01_F01_bin.150]